MNTKEEHSHFFLPNLGSYVHFPGKDCSMCGTVQVHPRRKYKLCADCIVRILKESNMIPQRDSYIDQTKDKGRKMCEICLDEVINHHRKTSLCMDCIVDALLMHNIIKRKDTIREKVIVKKIHPPETENGLFVEKFKGKNPQMCDACKRFIVHSHRTRTICVDCVIEALIREGVIEIQKEKELV